MTKMEALFLFWSGFALPAFEKSAVPTGSGNGVPDLPYITYEVKTDGFGVSVPLTASLWYRSSSVSDMERKQKEIARYIGRDGVFLPCDEGVLWIRRRVPFVKMKADGTDDMTKQMELNISVEFWTEE